MGVDENGRNISGSDPLFAPAWVVFAALEIWLAARSSPR